MRYDPGRYHVWWRMTTTQGVLVKKWLVLFNDTRQVCETPQAVIDMMILNRASHYRIVPLGETGSTVVWLAYDERTEELVDARCDQVPGASTCGSGLHR